MSFIDDKKDQVNEQIRQAIEKMSEANRYRKLIKAAEQDYEELKGKVEELKKQVEKEEQDVQNLMKMSFSNFLHTILNDKSEKLDKEQKEVVEAKLKYDTAVAQFTDCENNIKRMKGEYNNFVGAEREYKELIHRKRALLEQYIPDQWNKIERLMEEDRQISSQRKEVDEAIRAGNKVISHIDQAKAALDSAEGWGAWDMLGGGMMTTMIKREKMNQAQNDINTIQSLLRTFTRELGDVNTYVDIDLQIDSFLGFADYFFDGFFVDWVVQSKIHHAQDKIYSVYQQVQSIVRRLTSESTNLKSRRNRIDSEIQRIIEQA